jgi:hypothetical protein
MAFVNYGRQKHVKEIRRAERPAIKEAKRAHRRDARQSAGQPPSSMGENGRNAPRG